MFGSWRDARAYGGTRLLLGNLHRRDCANRRRSLRNVGCVNADPAFQGLKLPCKAGNLVVEFGGLATTAAVGNRSHNDGWQAHHHPSEEEQQYVFHSVAQFMGNLRCILERFWWKVLRYFAK